MKKIILFLLLTAFVKVNAQTTKLNMANQAYQKGNWAEAIQQFKSYRLEKPSDINGLLGLGASEVKIGDYKSAIAYLDSIFFLSPKRNDINHVDLFLAECYAALNDNEKALTYLNDAAIHGSRAYASLKDTLFGSMRNSSKFELISERFKENFNPVLFDNRYKKMDYFLGNWEVYVGTNYDQKVGVDTVFRISGGYSMLENFKWTAGGNYVGKSMTFFDPSIEKFRMCWVGSNGDIRNFEEVKSEENMMQLLAVTNSNENELIHRRMTITINPKDGSIHEYIENSSDMGKTWVADFDAMFRKTK